jgi:predicted esterase
VTRRSVAAALLAGVIVVGIVAACGEDEVDRAGPPEASDEPELDAGDGGGDPGGDGAGGPREYEEPFARFDGAVVTDLTYGGSGLERWSEEVQGIADVRIPSSIDGYEQPALWLAHDRDEPRPLLVVLHSWSVDYQQHMGIPYARWAAEQGWAMIHPDFRGIADRVEATGSDQTVQDVLDAIDWAADHAAIDPDRVFVTGFSGGGMMSLVMAGRHPDRFAGVVAWVPIYDLVEWYRYAPGWAYARDIEDSCGGNPLTEPEAGEECRRRSPSSYLEAAREAGLPVYLGHGIADGIVPPVHAAWAFNDLADPDLRLTGEELEVLSRLHLPEHLSGQVEAETYFREPDPRVLFARTSGSSTLVLFDGEHLGVFNPGLEWMNARATEVSDP